VECGCFTRCFTFNPLETLLYSFETRLGIGLQPYLPEGLPMHPLQGEIGGYKNDLYVNSKSKSPLYIGVLRELKENKELIKIFC
jgi:hypothetical protein